MKKQTKVILTVSAITALTAAVASVAAIDLLSDVAVKKELPRLAKPAQKRLYSTIASQDEMRNVYKLARVLESKSHRVVTIKSRDGLSLAGHLFLADNAKRTVVCMHGWRSGWSFDFGGPAEFLLNEGCNLLIAEQRSHGGSEGEYIGFGVYERYDCADWVRYVKNNLKGLPIYLCGVSMGATTVLMASGLDIRDDISGVIADCGFTSPRAIWSHVLKTGLKINDKVAYPIAKLIISKKAGFDGDEASTVQAMAQSKAPVLFVHGDADNFVPLYMTNETYDACKADKTLLVVKGAGHGMSWFVDPDAYKKAIIEFFKKNDILE